MENTNTEAIPYPGLKMTEESKTVKIGEKRLKATPIDLSQMPSSAMPETLKERFVRIVGIRFSETGRVYDFNAGDFDLKRGDAVVAEIPEKGIRLGWVSKPPLSVDNENLKLKLKYIQRLATEEDIENIGKHAEREKKAFQKTKELVLKYDLPMHILDLEYSLDLKKSIVYFTAETRVDFRNLLKELLIELKSRVELRQIGVRDETKVKGGLGPCGEEQCCSRFLNRFHPVSIKMAKNQGLSLKPTKVSGNCGRLKCCLAYEDDAYTDAGKKVPRKGSKCSKKCGNACGVVQDVDVLRQLVTVRFDDGSIEVLKASEIVEKSSTHRKYNHPNERIVADSESLETTDVDQIGNKKSKDDKEDKTLN
ncbi:MAG: stage 0 sporulation protein [Bdellovibrionaceae bacterium]|nr:stage 0 sporulation protein [Pseudobdellovibrionaceae bacterium]|tara:strand:- start:104555 stop:105649 length:1095 start_codon:yes stop_codon:yes gene_type:complete